VTTSTPALLDSFTALADPTRCRLLLLLEGHELTVSEICVVLQLPQSTVSRHLKMLSEAGLVASRREGTSRYYSLSLDGPQASSLKSHAELWQLARRELADRPAVAQDARRLDRVLADRSAASREFFASASAEWDRLRDELFGSEFYWRALVGLLPSTWVVGDLGCGTGAVTAALAPVVARVIGVDASDEMLEAAGQQLAAFANVTLRRGPLEALPIDDAVLDAATLVLVLHHLPEPAAALAEARRVLKPGGRLLIVDMTAHDREEYRQQMGHVWLGFSEDQARRLLEQAGFAGICVQPMPVVTAARGPALFAASAASASSVRHAAELDRAG
jgi:ArsR family transcriptional regulator